MKLRYTPAARADINDIYQSISRLNPVAAPQVEDTSPSPLKRSAEGRATVLSVKRFATVFGL
jgi:plasmid stabilization system protein ParE